MVDIVSSTLKVLLAYDLPTGVLATPAPTSNVTTLPNLFHMRYGRGALLKSKSIIIYLQCKPISKHYSVQHGSQRTYNLSLSASTTYIARQGIELRAKTGNRNIHNIWRKNQDLAFSNRIK